MRKQLCLYLELIWNWTVLVLLQDPAFQQSFAHVNHLQIKDPLSSAHALNYNTVLHRNQQLSSESL